MLLILRYIFPCSLHVAELQRLFLIWLALWQIVPPKKHQHRGIVFCTSVHSIGHTIYIFSTSQHHIPKKSLLVGQVDVLEPLNETYVILQQHHFWLQVLLAGLLRHGVEDERESLVLAVQLVPRSPQTLDGQSKEGDWLMSMSGLHLFLKGSTADWLPAQCVCLPSGQIFASQ